LDSKFRGATFQTTRLKITFRIEPVLKDLVNKGLLRYKRGKFFPTCYKAALQYNIPNIINYIKSVFRGLANYYGFAHNWYDAKTMYNYFGNYCAAMTIAQKTKSKTPKVFKKYGRNLVVTDKDNKEVANFRILTGKNFKRNVKSYSGSNLVVTDVKQLLLANLRIAKKQIVREPCIICGDPNTEMHHVKHVRKILTKKKPGSYDYYLEVMRLTNRKAIPVCQHHHNLIHAGKCNGVSLKTVFQNFKKEGIGFNQKKAEALVKRADLSLDSKK